MRLLDEKSIENIVNNKAYNEKQFNDITEAILKATIGIMNEHNPYTEGDTLFSNYSQITSLNNLSSSLIGTLAEGIGLVDMKINFSKLPNKDLRMLIDLIDEELNKYIARYLIKYSPEEFILCMMMFSGIMSKLTLSIYSDEEIELDLKDRLSVIKCAYQTVKKRGLEDVRIPLGEIKGAIELAINSVLLGEYTMQNKETYKDLDYIEILTMFNARNYLFQYKEIIPLLKEKRRELRLDKEKGIVIPYDLIELFGKYNNITEKETIRVENNLTKNIFSIFKDEMGFQPSDVISYISEKEENRAFKIYNNIVSVADKMLLPIDIMKNQNLTIEGAQNLIQMFILNDETYYDTSSANSYIGKESKRLFRTPIIETKTKLIVPTFTWLESIHYLSLRILNRNIILKDVAQNWNELLKNDYDEYDLETIKNFLMKRGYKAEINVDLSTIPELKREIECIKKMPHEIDLLYVQNQNLIIKDVKNYGMQHSFSDVKRLKNKIVKDKEKLKNLKDFIIRRKEVFEKIVEVPFDEIIVGILTVATTVYPFLEEKDDQIDVMTIREFESEFIDNK